MYLPFLQAISVGYTFSFLFKERCTLQRTLLSNKSRFFKIYANSITIFVKSLHGYFQPTPDLTYVGLEIPLIWSFCRQVPGKSCYIIDLPTPPLPEIIWVKNVRAIVVCGFLMNLLKKKILKIWKKSWEPFGSYLINSSANSAHFHSNWAGLAVLFSR